MTEPSISRVDKLIDASGYGRESDPAVFDRLRTELRLSFEEICNLVAIRIAERFLADDLDWGDADWAINMVWSRIVGAAEEHAFPEPARAIFEAFDEGEYDHGDGKDPVATRTVPMLRAALEQR